MQLRHLCCSHALLIQNDEQQAYHHWQSTMHSGIQAFVQCRMEEAKNYLSAALEIAMIRFSGGDNESFTVLQLIKPSEFLCQIYLCEENTAGASMVLRAIREIITSRDLPCDESDNAVLENIASKIDQKKHVERPQRINSFSFANASSSLH